MSVRTSLLSSLLLILTIFASLTHNQTAYASGGVGLPPPGGGSVGNTRKVDEVYEYGKSIYLGRAPGTEKIKYCVLRDGEPKKIKGRHLKAYKGKDKLTFANALLDCADTSKKALLSMERDHVPYVIYYLNKRYKLKLADT